MKQDAARGHKVVFSNPLNGRLLDQREARKQLRVNGVYTVVRTSQSGWVKKVFLLEVPNASFNIALFEDAR